MLFPQRNPRTTDYPQLATGEKVIAEAPLGRDVAVLTNRRLVVSGRDFEQSLALGMIGLVRVSFTRSVRGITIGAVLLAVAIVLASLAGPVRGAIFNQILSLDDTHRAEQAPPPSEPPTVPPATQVIVFLLRGLAALASLMSPVALVLGVVGLARGALGAIGETRVNVNAGGAEVVYSRRGRDVVLQQFVTEVARNLPAPAARQG